MSYGRNFGFRVPPMHGQRGSRYFLDEADDVVIGAPVIVDESGDENVLGQLPLNLAVGATARPKPGMGGILVYEYKGEEGWAGDDKFLTTYSDKDTAPAGASVQLVSGPEVKVWFLNTEDSTFLTVRDYEGRVMVAGLGATSSVALGDYLTPGAGTDNGGYWGETASEANAWLVVTKVDVEAGLVEARFCF